jgi:hypothetical protein
MRRRLDRTQDIAVYFHYVVAGELCGDDPAGTTHSQHFNADTLP